MNGTFGWCFIGCGTLAAKVAKQINRSGRHRIVSVYSRDFDKVSAFTRRYGGTPCRGAEEAMTADGVDAVYVVTPHDSHFAYARRALLLDRPVLCEKPLTVTADQARELAELAEDRRVYLAEAMWTWFSPVANAVKTWLDDGDFGQITRFVLNSHWPAVGYAPRVTDPNHAGGALLDMGVYAVTYMYRLFGMPSQVTCVGEVSDGIDWGEDITFTYPSGATYAASVSIRDMRGGSQLFIEGTRARTRIPFFHSAKRATLVRPPWKSIRVSGGGTYLGEFDIVASEIRQGLTQSAYVPLQSSVDVMTILDECRRQLHLVYPFETDRA